MGEPSLLTRPPSANRHRLVSDEQEVEEVGGLVVALCTPAGLACSPMDGWEGTHAMPACTHVRAARLQQAFTCVLHRPLCPAS